MTDRWNVTLLIHRKKAQGSPRFDAFRLELNPDAYLLDAVEQVWAFHDRSLVFAHACHHATCGVCGMLANGVERLACITPIREIAADGGTVRLEPLRNFPVLSDLVVDMRGLYERLEAVHFSSIEPLPDAPVDKAIAPAESTDDGRLRRLVDCIECGLCMSACPIVGTSPEYLGPAVLAAVHHEGLNGTSDRLELADSAEGLWRCHGIHECTEVCPSNVEPARRIMELRRQVVKMRFKSLFRSRS